MKVKVVTVIGANGTMGTNVAGIFASFGNCKVNLLSRTISKSEDAKRKAIQSVKADSIGNNLKVYDYSMMKECIQKADLIFESVAESVEIKREIYEYISKYVGNKTVICTGTSGLSVNELAQTFSVEQRERFLGVHFFNPPYNLTLCEVIPNVNTSSRLVNELSLYLEKQLLRKVVLSKDKPAFLGNRIGFQFINEAMIYAEKYAASGGIEYIDQILGPFTGRSMSPIFTADFVGLDVHKAIVDNVYHNTEDYAHETFKLPSYVNKMISEGKLGKKVKEGLYKTIVLEDGTRKQLIYDLEMMDYRAKSDDRPEFAKKMVNKLRTGDYHECIEILKRGDTQEAQICVELLTKYVIYALHIADEVGDSITAADDVMATGFNWIPPIAYIEAWGGVDEFIEYVKSNFSEDISRHTSILDILKRASKSEYDYKMYFRAK
ncbi:3-hydroxyacyl-CoA dehydrogenase [Lachnospiraceae bacterium PF1-22]|uniref:3-hydroxyacyl-CoA dehydrogenase family protein n=1 Tax=Ohessyouella blattaphilus TaxID=2949333 RepID=UPI003E2DC966